MCRFAVYQGPPIPVSHLLVTPSHSLRKQSFACRERRSPLNEDGYGIGWYNSNGGPHWIHGDLPANLDPAFEPAARAIRSACFFGHVRAATQGMVPSVENCHPFSSGPLLWMHNGLISGFEIIQPLLREEIKGGPYRMRGNTDSEASFALFLKMLERQKASGLDRLQQAMVGTIRQLERWRQETSIQETHYLNLAVTDGTHTVVTRYYQSVGLQLTLYYWRGDAAEIAAWSGSEEYEAGPAIIVASEPLHDSSTGWQPVPVNYLLAFGPETFRIVALSSETH